MKFIFLILILFFCTILWGCEKTTNQSSLDFSQQWQTDYSGNLINGVSNQADSQWQNRSLLPREVALFKSLDTTDLTGTTVPDSINSAIFFPNPLSTQAQLYFSFNTSYSGQIKFKYVVVDNNMNPLQKGTSLLSRNQAFFHLEAIFPIGYYRIYFALCSQSNENFYTSWGNIQRTK